MKYVVKRKQSYVSTYSKNSKVDICIGRFDHEKVFESNEEFNTSVVYQCDNLDDAFKYCDKYMFGNYVKLHPYYKDACIRDKLYIFEYDEDDDKLTEIVDIYYQDIVVRDFEE